MKKYEKVCIVCAILLFIVLFGMKKRTPNNKKMVIVMYGRESCPYCVRMRNQLRKDGVWKYVEYRNVETSSVHRNAYRHKLNSPGVPYFMNPSNNKTTMGSQPTDKLLKNLGIA